MQHQPSFTVNQLLQLLEAHLQQHGPEAGETTVQLLPEGLLFGRTDSAIAYRTSLPISGTLTQLEQLRLEVLDRKAKGGWLTSQEDAEFEGLLQLQHNQRFTQAIARGKAA